MGDSIIRIITNMYTRRLFALCLLVFVFFIIDVFWGLKSFDYQFIIDFFKGNALENPSYTTLLLFRLPKAITAVLVGMALSVSGLLMQTVFRNPLAGPYVLGVSSGAGLGVALAILGFSAIGISIPFGLQNGMVILFAVVGATFVLGILLLVSMRINDIMTILILGMLFSSAISALISILQYFSPESSLKAYVIWTMGSLATVSYSQLVWLSLAVTFGILLAFLKVKDLDLMLLGEQYAISTGLNVKRFRVIIFIATGLLAGSVTAFCGPIGFIGVAVPHIARIVTRTTDHFYLLIFSSLIGACVVLLSDILSQLPGTIGVLPINSVTALLGIPVVVWIIFNNHRFGSGF